MSAKPPGSPEDDRKNFGNSWSSGRSTFTPANGLWRGAVEVPLPPRAVAVLAALLARPGQLVSKADLLDAAWKDAFVTEASLLEAIHVLRVALGDDSQGALLHPDRPPPRLSVRRASGRLRRGPVLHRPCLRPMTTRPP